MTASGTAGYGTELAAVPRPAALGARGGQVARRVRVGGQPGAAAAPAGAGMLNAVGLQGPGVAHWLDHVLPALLRTGATVVRQHLGPLGRRLPARPPSCWPAPAGGRRRRGQPVVPEPRGPARHLRPRRRAVGGGHRRHGGRAAGRAGPSSAPTPTASSRSPRPSHGRRRGGDAGQHAARAGRSTRRRARRRSAPAAGAVAAGRSTRSPCARSYDVHAALPTCRSSASAASPAGGTPWSCCSPGRAPCRSGRPRSPTRGRRRRTCSQRAGERGATDDGVPSVAELVRGCSSTTCHAWMRGQVLWFDMATPPQLTPEQRAAALAKAAEARAARAEIKARLKMGRCRSPKHSRPTTHRRQAQGRSRCSNRCPASARSRPARSWKRSASPTTAACRASAPQQKASLLDQLGK